MRKIFWVFTPLAFCLGIGLGVFGYMYWQSHFQPGINLPDKTNAEKVSDTNFSPFYPPGYQNNNLTESQNNTQIAISEMEQEKLFSDYKQAVGILFEAWKEKDISGFRTKLSGAYTGEILENHVNKAKKYLSDGIGIYVSKVTFDHIGIESADKYSATIDAIYRYDSEDYDLNEEYPFGEKVSHFVHVRANLVKIDSKWMITSETLI